MGNTLELYKEIFEANQRFSTEVFENHEYAKALPQLTIIDAGAYEGEFSFYCLNIAKKIYAFEPDPRPGKVFAERIDKYDLSNKIKFYDQALAGKTGDRLFNATGHGGSSLQPGNGTSLGPMIKVKAMSLADVFKENKIEKVDILKIDIESGEEEVFRNAAFKKLAPKIDVIIGEHLESLRNYFKRLGYKETIDRNNFIYKR